jgi:hypothetical protein
MRLKTTVIGPTTSKTFRKELLVLILGQPPSTGSGHVTSGTASRIGLAAGDGD